MREFLVMKVVAEFTIDRCLSSADRDNLNIPFDQSQTMTHL